MYTKRMPQRRRLLAAWRAYRAAKWLPHNPYKPLPQCQQCHHYVLPAEAQPGEYSAPRGWHDPRNLRGWKEGHIAGVREERTRQERKRNLERRRRREANQ